MPRASKQKPRWFDKAVPYVQKLIIASWLFLLSSFFFLLVFLFFRILIGLLSQQILMFSLNWLGQQYWNFKMIFLSCNSLLYPHTTWCLVYSLFSTAEEIFMQWWLQLWTYGSILFVAVMSMPSTLPPRFRTKLKVEEISMKS